jgi:hypothetical protein
VRTKIKTVIWGALGLGICFSILLSLGVYFALTNPKLALQTKIQIQNYLGRRDVTEELIWVSFDEISKIEHNLRQARALTPAVCGLAKSSYKCVEIYVNNELSNDLLTSAGLVFIMGNLISNSISSSEHFTLAENFTRPLTLIRQIKKGTEKFESTKQSSILAVEKKFGGLSDIDKKTLQATLENPLAALKQKLNVQSKNSYEYRLPSNANHK